MTIKLTEEQEEKIIKHILKTYSDTHRCSCYIHHCREPEPFDYIDTDYQELKLMVEDIIEMALEFNNEKVEVQNEA